MVLLDDIVEILYAPQLTIRGGTFSLTEVENASG
jgi:hypothetical protein